MQPLLEILSIQNVAIILAKRVIYPNSSEYIFTKEPVVKGFTISGTSELELKSNTSEKIQQAQEAVRLAKIAQDLTTKLQELVQTKQLHPRSPLTGGLDNQSHGEQIHVNVIEAEVALNEHFDIQFENPPSDNLPESENKHRCGVTHKIQTRRNIMSSVIELAIEKAQDSSDPHSVWAYLVNLAESENRPAPLLGYIEDEGVKYQAEKEVKFLSKKNFIQRIKRR